MAEKPKIWLVGSAPKELEDAEQAAAFYLEQSAAAGCQPFALPGGETLPMRRNWRQGFMDNLSHPALERVEEADWSNNLPPHYKVKDPHALTAESLRKFLGYYDEARTEYGMVTDVRERFHRDTIPYQIGIASPMIGAMALAGRVLSKPIPRPRYAGVFRGATALEIADIQEWTGGDVVFELELPPEVLMLHKTPSPLRSRIAKRLARNVVETVELADQKCREACLDLPRIAIHGCTGDFNQEEHRTLVRPRDLKGLVLLANEIAAAWPKDRDPPEVMHLPAAFGEYAAPSDPGFYAALGRLALHENTRLALGVVHEDSNAESLQHIMMIARSTLPYYLQEFMLATACGDGRREQGVVEKNFRTMGEALKMM